MALYGVYAYLGNFWIVYFLQYMRGNKLILILWLYYNKNIEYNPNYSRAMNDIIILQIKERNIFF